MSKYIIELNDKCARGIVVFGKTDEGVISTTQYVENLEVLNSDYINEHFGDLQDTAYQRGFEDGKKEAESSEHIKSITADAFNKGMLFKEEKINDAFKRGFEKGKAVNDKGCEGCEYAGKVVTGPPCISCCNSYRNQWTAKSDKIEVGDEDSIIAGDEVKAEDGTVVFFVTWMSDRCICGVDKEGKCYSYEPKEICGKTGRHFDIILEEKKA